MSLSEICSLKNDKHSCDISKIIQRLCPGKAPVNIHEIKSQKIDDHASRPTIGFFQTPSIFPPNSAIDDAIGNRFDRFFDPFSMVESIFNSHGFPPGIDGGRDSDLFKRRKYVPELHVKPGDVQSAKQGPPQGHITGTIEDI